MVLNIKFSGQVVRVRGDGALALEDAVKQSIQESFGQTRAWADAHVDVEQLLARNLAIDMGSGIMFGKALNARGFNAFASEMLGHEGHEGQDARTILDVLRKMARLHPDKKIKDCPSQDKRADVKDPEPRSCC